LPSGNSWWKRDVPWWAWPFVIPGLLVAVVGALFAILFDPAGKWERLTLLALVVAGLLFATGHVAWGVVAVAAAVGLGWITWRSWRSVLRSPSSESKKSDAT
jgi:NhaP-type Na+/H+ or K+/H+ antiporter